MSQKVQNVKMVLVSKCVCVCLGRHVSVCACICVYLYLCLHVPIIKFVSLADVPNEPKVQNVQIFNNS